MTQKFIYFSLNLKIIYQQNMSELNIVLKFEEK